VDRQAAMAAGASDYMPKSVTPDQILAKIKALLQEAGIDPGATKGKMVGLLSLRGGVGVTSLSVNLAVALALSRRIAVGLLDLAPLAGHAALLLGLRPTKSYLDVFATDVVTMDHIRPCLISHDSGVQLLASPLSQPGTAVDGEHFSDLGHRLSIAFPYTVVDLAHSLSAASNALLPNISNVILVIGPDIGSIQSAAVAQQRLATLGLDQQRISLVLNHTSPASGLGRAAIEKALHREVAHEIPYAAEMLSALNNRTPLMLHAPQSGVAKAIARLVASLTG
jgi:pilus assembly protein CpaE